MGNRVTLGAAVLLAAVFGDALNLNAGDHDDPPRIQGDLEIVQRVVEQERGDEMTIVEVKITNRGAREAEWVELSGTEPRGYRLRAATTIPHRDDNRLLWTLGNLKTGATRTLRLQWEPLPDMTDIPLKSILHVSHRCPAESEIEVPAKKVSAKIAITVPERATVGVPAVFRLEVTNASQRPIQDAVLQASFGVGLSHAMGKELENPLGSIEGGKTRSFPLELIPTKAGELRGAVRIKLASGAVSEQEFVVQAVEPAAALSIAAPARCVCREPMHLTFTAQNNGTEPNRRARLVVRFPGVSNFLAASEGGANVADGCVYWDLADLKPGQQRVLRLDMVATSPGEQKITAILSADGREPSSHSIVVQVQGEAAHDPPQGRRP